MSEADVDELFGGSGSAAKPRVGRIIAVLVTGMTLTVLGMACTAVPGGLVTLVAWALAEKELGRVDSGYLPVEARPGLVTLRTIILLCLIAVLVLFIIQGALLCTGVYFQMWSAAVESLRPLVIVPEPPLPS